MGTKLSLATTGLLVITILSSCNSVANAGQGSKPGSRKGSAEGMAKTEFGKKLWSVIGEPLDQAKKVFGEPTKKDKWGAGYSIPGFSSNEQGPSGVAISNDLINFFDPYKKGVSVSGMLGFKHLGITRAKDLFAAIGWDLSKWKSIKKSVSDGDYSEKLEYNGVEFNITVLADGHSSNGDSMFSVSLKQ